MPVLVRIALRNLLEHKAKSFIIGLIIAIGVIILVVGNSFIDTAALGIQRSFVHNFTGSVFIAGKADAPVSLLGVSSVGGTESTPLLPDYRQIMDHIAKLKEVKGATSQVTAIALLNVEGNDNTEDSVPTIVFGIDPSTYRLMFDNLQFVSGGYLLPGQEGILLSTQQVAKIGKDLKTEIRTGDKVLLNSFGSAGFHIREVTVRGIFAFKQVDPMDTVSGGNVSISYVDIQTVRALEGMVVSSTNITHVDKAATSLLSAGDNAVADMFGGGNMVQVDQNASRPVSSGDLTSILGDRSSVKPAEQLDTGAWNFILADLKNPNDAPQVIRTLNAWFASQKIDAQAGDWKTAAGGFGAIADIIRVVFVVAVLIVAVVAVIIIMNTLMISVIERTSEIGTMRALGAQKGFVWRMFIVETLTVSVVFGVAGMLLGSILIGILNIVGIHAGSAFLEILFAGPVLRPTISLTSLAGSLVVVVIIGILSHIYPVSIALKIQPVRAIQTE